MNVQGKCYINVNVYTQGKGKDKKEIDLFSIGITNGEKDDKKVTAYLNVNFSNKAKDKFYDNLEDDKNSVLVDITEAWLKPYTTNEGENKLKLFVNDFEVVTRKKGRR